MYQRVLRWQLDHLERCLFLDGTALFARPLAKPRWLKEVQETHERGMPLCRSTLVLK
jgi:hypothetical protein